MKEVEVTGPETQEVTKEMKEVPVLDSDGKQVNEDVEKPVLDKDGKPVMERHPIIATPSDKRQELMLMWLIHAVDIAEKEFGSKTGSLKLSYVYKMFLGKYGILGMFMSQAIFESLVNKALKTMEETFKEALNELPK
ncbi:hypothetical protein [Lysinibacillus sp. NPDC086135]|uniref:hypothetical protein n=1 Tax=Lysinibacillus sp. NPDC086135 TaxID=3364130 RepID=UPI00382D53B7